MAQKGINQLARDGRVHIKKTGKKYDLVIVNFSDPSTAMINRFYTEDFFNDVKRILADDGVVTLSITSAVNYVGEEVGLYVGSVYNTLGSVFKDLLVIPGDTARIFASPDNSVISSDWTVLEKRYLDKKNIAPGNFSPLIFKTILNRSRIDKVKSALDQFNSAGKNTDRRPITFYYNLLLQDQFADGKAKTFLSFFRRAGAFTSILSVICFGAIILLVLIFLKKRNPGLKNRVRGFWLIFTTGMAAMSIELVILLAFQNAHGALYERIGLLVALFMAGLTVGGSVVTWSMEKHLVDYNRFIYISELILILAAILIGLLVSLYLPAPIFYMFAMLAGIGAGAQFPLAAKMAQPKGGAIGKTAGLIDWADHFGAFFGAALTGVILIPILGLTETCAIIAVVKTTSLVSMWFSS